ncbi:hypothetical protein HDU97_009861 [Phlyctochytrium planicorne]|nr:hypothetical protein HDU97_009861 [Phlyctochytrium planicorne]
MFPAPVPRFELGRQFRLLESVHQTLATPYAVAAVVSAWNLVLEKRESGQGGRRHAENASSRSRKRKRKNASQTQDVEDDAFEGSEAMAGPSFADTYDDDEDAEVGVAQEERIQEDEDDEDEISEVEQTADSSQKDWKRGMVFRGDEIWQWQADQEQIAFERGCRVHLKIPDEEAIQVTNWTNDTYNAGMEAVSVHWEPNRSFYGAHGWYGHDQAHQGSVIERPRKFSRIQPYAGSFEPLAAGEDTTDINADTPTVEVQPIEVVGHTFTLDELLEDVATIPDSEILEVAVGQIVDEDVSGEIGDIVNGQLIGMEVERDVVYDESELTPEEIEIQRWSISWKESHAKDAKVLEDMKLAYQNSHAFKSRTYPARYGSHSEDIITLETKINRIFQETGGSGTVGGTEPILEDDNEGPTTGRKRAAKKERNPQGKIEADSRRVLWPVLPIRW